MLNVQMWNMRTIPVFHIWTFNASAANMSTIPVWPCRIWTFNASQCGLEERQEPCSTFRLVGGGDIKCPSVEHEYYPSVAL